MIAAIGAVLASFVLVQEPDVVPTPRLAIGWAAEHQAVVEEGSKGDWRYLVAPGWADNDWIAGISIALNTACNREGIPYRPTVLANGWACGINFAALCSDPVERREILSVWDSLALKDPYFHVPSTNSQLNVPVVASHLPQDQVSLVVAWSNQPNRHGVVPIYNAAFAASQVLSADEGVYYELRGVEYQGSKLRRLPSVRVFDVVESTNLVAIEGGKTAIIHPLREGASVTSREDRSYKGWLPVKHNGVDGWVESVRVVHASESNSSSGSKTEEDHWLAERGASISLSAKFRSDRRKGTFRSGVTSAPRSVVAFRGAVGKVWLTEDAEGVSSDKHPIHNLQPDENGRLPADAKELIAEMAWGGHDYLLTDGSGKIQRVAVLNGTAVRDSTVPAPHPAVLTPAISCIRCHWRGDHIPLLARLSAGEKANRVDNNGLRLVPNDVQILLDPRGGVDILGTGSDLSRLAGLYAGGTVFDRELQLGRDKLRLAVLQATEGLVQGKPEGLTVPQAADAIIKLFNSYRYDDVTAEVAALELGVKVGKENATETLSSLIGGAVDNPDATLLALIRGLNVRREDWDRVYGDAYSAVIQKQELEESIDGGNE